MPREPAMHSRHLEKMAAFDLAQRNSTDHHGAAA